MPDQARTLTQNVFVGTKLHATDESTAETLANTDFEAPLAEVQMAQWDVARFDRALTGEDLDREPGRPTRKKLTLTHSEEIQSRGADAASLPYFHPKLIACGFQRAQVRKINVDAPTGTFRTGEVITDGAAKSAVLLDVMNVGGAGDWRLWWVELAGGDFADGDTITGDTSAATAAVATGATAADGGHNYRTLSESTGVVPPAATHTHLRGGHAYRLIGARGDAVMRFSESNPGILEFTMSGAPDLTAQLGLPAESPPANIAVVPDVSPIATAANMILDPAGENYLPPVISSFEARVGNTVSDRPTITAGSIGQTGYRPPRISQRAATLQFDPEKVSESVHGSVKRAMTGAGAEIDLRYGDPTAAGGRVAFFAYEAQYQAPQAADREGVLVETITADIRRGPRTDWAFHLALLHA